MNPHLKLAYEHGVRTALYEGGLVKQAIFSETRNTDPEMGALLGLGAGGALEYGSQKFVDAPSFRELYKDRGILSDTRAKNILKALGFTGSNADLAPSWGFDVTEPASLSVGKGVDTGRLAAHINLNPLEGHGGPTTFAHEAGHATGLKPGLLNKLRRASMRTFYPYSALLGAAASTATLLTGHEGDNPYLMPVVAGAGSQLPKILEEGAASLKGYKALKRTGDYAPGALRHARKNLIAAGLSYLLPGMAIAATPAAIRYGQRNYGD